MAKEELLLQLKEKDLEINKLREEFEDFQEMSKSIEAELENELEQEQQKNKKLQRQNDQLKEQLDSFKLQQITKCKELESLNNKLTSSNSALEEKLNQALRSKRHLETEMDFYKAKLREKDHEIEKLTEFYHQTLEDLAITCSELETYKDLNKESTYRLQEQISELNHELDVARKISLKRMQDHNRQMKNGYGSLKSSMSGQRATVMVDLLIDSLSSQLNCYKT